MNCTNFRQLPEPFKNREKALKKAATAKMAKFRGFARKPSPGPGFATP